ncbi:MAG: choice-of-anchor tandem repeat GloVer-containing protein, partial [Candidatus Korobacteraceae bacterium]
GPINGTTDAWTINFGFITSDSFTVTQGDNTSITGMRFGAWLIEGDTLQSVQVSITSGENGGTSYFNQTVNFTQSACSANQYVYDICLETSSAFSGLALNNGTYWVNLQNAVTAEGEPIYWDENSGVGCTGPGCPSSASESEVGTIPSEAFTILGSSTTTTTSSTTYSDYACPAPQTGFHDLHDFSPGAGPSGLAIDTAGKLYGTFANGGSYGAGLLYDFAQRAGHWFLSSLYSFLGGSGGNSPNGVIVGPSGALYGAADGGLANCGGSYCGLIYEASPSSTVCATALCSWNETTIYEFTSLTDAWGGTVTAFDSAGNLYGISGSGGAYGNGAVFELTPSQGGWTEQILYSFTWGNAGVGPNSLLVGHDGNLYGTAGWGGVYGYGVVFQLVPSAGGWTENVLYSFTGTTDGWAPGGLIQDSQGNLAGFSICWAPGGWNENYCQAYGGLVEVGLIFAMSPSGSGWSFSVIYNAGQDEQCYAPWNQASNLIRGLTQDAAGNLYAAEGGILEYCNGLSCFEEYCDQIVRVGYGGVLVTGNADIFGNITSDANGNLYGTTNTCGFESPLRTSGMIWQYSP